MKDTIYCIIIGCNIAKPLYNYRECNTEPVAPSEVDSSM